MKKRSVGRPRKYATNAARQRAYRRRLKRSLHFRSTTHLWETPQWLFDELHAEFGFTVDVCAFPENAKCDQYFTPDQDGLAQDWQGVCWCNPPYGTVIGRWVQKAYESSKTGAMVVGVYATFVQKLSIPYYTHNLSRVNPPLFCV